MQIHENLLYVAAFGQPADPPNLRSQGLLHILDIHDPDNPTLLAALPLAGRSATDVAVVEDLAYVALDWDWFQRVDVHDPLQPVAQAWYQYQYSYYGMDSWESAVDEAHNFASATSISHMEVHGDWLYTIGTRQNKDTGAALRIIDIRDPNQPRIAGGKDFPDGSRAHMEVERAFIYVALDNPSGKPGELHMLRMKR